MLSSLRVNPAGFQSLGTRGECLNERLQFRRGRRVADGRLFAVQFRARQIQHRGGLHVGGLAEHLHQFRHVDEPGEARVQPVARAVRRKLHRRHRLAERRRPRIEVMQVVLLQVVRLQIPLHGEHLGHAVGDGRAGGEHHPAAAVQRLDVAHLQKHIERPFAGGLRQSGDARHLGDVKQILEIVRLVHEQPVHAEFLKGQRVVLLVLGGERLKFGFQPLLRLFEFLHHAAIGTVRVLAFDHFQLVKLLLEESFLRFARKRDALEAGVRDDDGIPIAGGDAAEQFLAVLRLEILLAGDQDVRARIQRQQLGGELAEHVIGDDEHRLAGQDQAASIPSRRRPSCRSCPRQRHGRAACSAFAECARRRPSDVREVESPRSRRATSGGRR